MSNFWQEKRLEEMSDSEWEALCDGCGLCCYQKMIDGYGKYERLYYTSIACNQLDLTTHQCQNYSSRFELEPECTKLTKTNLPEFNWLPTTCAYRLLYEGKPLFDWHPLISGSYDTVKLAQIPIQNGIHAKDVIQWFDHIIDSEPVR